MAQGIAPGNYYREGISLIQIVEMFPDNRTATTWFEDQLWGETGRCCGHCGSVATKRVPNAKPMPYWCRDCRSYFSICTGTPMARTRVSMRKWAIAVYLCSTRIKGISSMELHRALNVTQRTAWYMLHRLRKAWASEKPDSKFGGPVEIDETYVGGRRKNMHNAKRKKLKGRGSVGKTAVVGMRDRDSTASRQSPCRMSTKRMRRR